MSITRRCAELSFDFLLVFELSEVIVLLDPLHLLFGPPWFLFYALGIVAIRSDRLLAVDFFILLQLAHLAVGLAVALSPLLILRSIVIVFTVQIRFMLRYLLRERQQLAAQRALQQELFGGLVGSGIRSGPGPRPSSLARAEFALNLQLEGVNLSQQAHSPALTGQATPPLQPSSLPRPPSASMTSAQA